jgi:hypothetical protein
MANLSCESVQAAFERMFPKNRRAEFTSEMHEDYEILKAALFSSVQKPSVSPQYAAELGRQIDELEAEVAALRAQRPSHIERSEAGVIDWKTEVERLNQIIAAYENRHPELDDLLRGEPHPEIGWPTQEQIKKALAAQDDPVSSTKSPTRQAAPSDVQEALLAATISSCAGTILIDCHSSKDLETIYDWIEASAGSVTSTNNPDPTNIAAPEEAERRRDGGSD